MCCSRGIRPASYFNPRPPRGGRRLLTSMIAAHGNFNPRPPRGGRLNFFVYAANDMLISIHAPREGGDGYSA